MRKLIISLIIMWFPIIGMSQASWDDLSDYLPLVSEGKQWVNERVIIANGDTTSYYYIYLIEGEAPSAEDYTYSDGDVMACHYYEGTLCDFSNDSIISCLEETSGTCLVKCFGNNALDKVEREGRNLLTRSYYISDNCAEFLYFFGDALIDQTIKGDYLLRQNEPAILTEENFTEVSTINIDGYNCHRLAYVDEQGDTLALVVEGIGFDSHDMGDLLTPFTRKPDPNADYQEYWGLSHVIKDGKIIYKGMRYREGVQTGINEIEADQRRMMDGNYYNLMGQPVGKQVPQTPGIYIHNGKKICVSRTP